MIREERTFDLAPGRKTEGDVVYWMSREQRMGDNPGLLFARHLAAKMDCGLSVVFTLADSFQGATLRHYDFMLRGIQEVALSLQKLNIPFFIVQGNPPEKLLEFAEANKTGTVVVDFDPLRIKRDWISEAIRKLPCKFIEVDGHNIVPARFVSDKCEFAAYTLRPKINRLLGDFIEEFPKLEPMPAGSGISFASNPADLLNALKTDRRVAPVDWILPGEKEALKVLNAFIKERLPGYKEHRNDPNKEMVSDLSPYLHFGQISSQRIASEVLKRHGRDKNSEAFLEELIVRKELSDNFCHYNPDYDKVNGFHDWAKKTHKEHASDEREYNYTTAEFEEGRTRDPLWNAAQMQMVKRGKMHGYMRMYWAKKILEWTETPAEAMETAIYLNDRYELDGRDPNGYTGIAWSIGGVHDRAWTERPVFGKIRYMNFNGCKRKFDVDAYISSIERR
ncbi:MAG: deoxyribodipyrimidine photo-lyase [Bacteroidales bacterium]